MQYVETLQEQLADLESSGRIPPNLLDAYQKRTETLSGMLRRAEVPDLCRLLSSMQVAKAAAAAGGGARDSGPVAMDTSGSGPAHASSARPSAPLVMTVPKPIHPKPISGNIPPQDGSSSSSPPPPLKPISLSAATQARIQAQGKTQENLTDELVDLAAGLKLNTLAMEAKVKERGTLLDSTEDALDRSATETKNAANKATQIHRRGRVNFCFTILVLLIIGVGFAGMYIFIRITSFTGYKASKATKLPPPAPMAVDPVPIEASPLPHGGEL